MVRFLVARRPWWPLLHRNMPESGFPVMSQPCPARFTHEGADDMAEMTWLKPPFRRRRATSAAGKAQQDVAGRLQAAAA
ncbi:hypothetical protein [Falsiroseomonas selenitidurans]|uniref:Uncharacterized protein n=1 Tax=Falsiroseomonas selenitidurans TaxID=2716335 RepID=A0ABX1E625_9PROT|nr:hypothetical protein [Falsiroseomonas selenitidurans]NKC32233.1 hypothetical protein [Falsiroseomonas selenitidurans]